MRILFQPPRYPGSSTAKAFSPPPQHINLSLNSSYCCLIISTVAGVMHVQTQYSAVWNIPWYLYQNTAQVTQRPAAKWKPNVTRTQPEIPTKSFTKQLHERSRTSAPAFLDIFAMRVITVVIISVVIPPLPRPSRLELELR